MPVLTEIKPTTFYTGGFGPNKQNYRKVYLFKIKYTKRDERKNKIKIKHGQLLTFSQQVKTNNEFQYYTLIHEDKTNEKKNTYTKKL